MGSGPCYPFIFGFGSSCSSKGKLQIVRCLDAPDGITFCHGVRDMPQNFTVRGEKYSENQIRFHI